jgi:hypothetical protein
VERRQFLSVAVNDVRYTLGSMPEPATPHA